MELSDELTTLSESYENQENFEVGIVSGFVPGGDGSVRWTSKDESRFRQFTVP